MANLQRLDTRVEALFRGDAAFVGIRTRPRKILGTFYQSCFYRVVFDICRNAEILGLITNPMVIGLRLPKRLPRTIQNQIRLARGKTLMDCSKRLGLILGSSRMCT